MSETKSQPLEVLRTYMKGNFTLDLDKAATQTLWDECQKAEDEIASLEARLAEATEIIRDVGEDCPLCDMMWTRDGNTHSDTCRIGRFLAEKGGEA